MFVINLTSPLTFILMTIVTILLIFLGQEIKKSSIAIIPLVIYLGLLVMHVIQLLTLSAEFADLRPVLTGCLALDFIFILVSFFSYLWVDDIEAKAGTKKSIDNSLDWFWKKI